MLHMVALCSVLLPHSKRVSGSRSGLGFFCVEFACFVEYVGFLWFALTVQKYALRSAGDAAFGNVTVTGVCDLFQGVFPVFTPCWMDVRTFS